MFSVFSDSTTARCRRCRSHLICIVIAGVLVLSILPGGFRASAEDWPGFHGLGIAGVLPQATFPESWDGQDYRWKYPLQTRDVGSMAIQGGRVFLLAMDASSQSLRLIAVDLETGEESWTREFPQAENHLHVRNTLASSTPATDDRHVYIAHSDREHTWLRCLDHDGKEIWTRDFGSAQSQHGFGTSPAVHGETVLLNFSQQADRVRDG